MKVKLTSHEVNAISVVVQQKNILPKDFLLTTTKPTLSEDAFDIVQLILADDFDKLVISNAEAKKEIANHYLKWDSINKNMRTR